MFLKLDPLVLEIHEHLAGVFEIADFEEIRSGRLFPFQHRSRNLHDLEGSLACDGLFIFDELVARGFGWHSPGEFAIWDV